MNLMILKHDAKYNMAKDIANKIEEESKELQNALRCGTGEQVVDEALDLITVCLNAINSTSFNMQGIEVLIDIHQEKLKTRGWESKKYVNFEIINNKSEVK